jgi:chromosome partitioning protein
MSNLQKCLIQKQSTGLARKGKTTLLIDIDSQANSSKVLIANYPEITVDKTIYTTILERNPLPIHQTKIPGLSIIPSHILLSNTDIELSTAIDHREARLKNELTKIASDYDYVIIDCPPTLSWLRINALTASDEVIVVVSPGYFELDSIVQISKTIREVQEYFNPTLELEGILFTMSDSTLGIKETR